jgi:FHS family Na+ dependent glucose MFS transporter 1
LDSKRQKRNQSIGYFGAFIALGMGMAILGPSLPRLAENTGSTISQISILFTASSGGYFLGSVLGGRLYDRYAGHPILAMILGVMILGIALIPFMPLLWILAAVLFFLGAFQGVLDVGCNTLLIWVYRRDVSPYMNALHFFFGVGTFIAPIILAQSALLSGDIKLGYILIALMIIPVLIWITRQPSPSAQDQNEETAEKGPQNLRQNVILIVFTATILFFYVGAELGFGGWIYTYALESNLADATTAAYLTSAFWGAFSIGRLVSIPLATRMRPRTQMFADFAGCIAGMLIIILFAGSQIALWTGTMVVGFSMASVFPVTITLAERRMVVTGQITSWFFVGVGLGSMLMPWLIGQLIEPIGPLAAMYVILAAILLDFLVFLGMLRFSQQSQPI